MTQYKLFVMLIQAICLFSFQAFAGFDRIPQPTAVFARGMSGVALQNPFSLWINPAAIGKNTDFQSTFFYSPSPFQLSQLSNAGFIVSDQLYGTGLSIGMNTLGFSLYRENVVTLSASHALADDIFVGAGINFYHLGIERYGTELNVGLDIGMIACVTENIFIGASIQNFNRPMIGKDENSIPQTILSGISFSPMTNTSITFDLVKDISYPISYRIGLEFSPMDAFVVRGGFHEDRSRLFGGIGFSFSVFEFDYGIATHQELGLTHSIGVSIVP